MYFSGGVLDNTDLLESGSHSVLELAINESALFTIPAENWIHHMVWAYVPSAPCGNEFNWQVRTSTIWHSIEKIAIVGLTEFRVSENHLSSQGERFSACVCTCVPGGGSVYGEGTCTVGYARHVCLLGGYLLPWTLCDWHSSLNSVAQLDLRGEALRWEIWNYLAKPHVALSLLNLISNE